MMAGVWAIMLLMTSIQSIKSLPHDFSTNTDIVHTGKLLDQWPAVEYMCPSYCECIGLNNNLTIDCSYQKLEFIPLNIHPYVFSLKLVSNNILKLSYNVSLQSLNVLDMSRNSISEIDTQWVNSLVHLKYLNLSKNDLYSKNIENTFQNISLFHLDLSNNRISTITVEMFSHLSSLLMLNLSSNEIYNISYNSFSNLNNLISLDLSNNKLANIQHEWFMNFHKLQRLSLRQNNLKLLRNVVFSTLKDLQVLDLSKNNIKSVGLLSFKRLANLHFLNVSNNNISHLQDGVFRSLDSLKTIDLSHNPLNSINNIFIYTKNLQFLHLKNLSTLKQLTHSSLVGTQQLKLLDLSGSKALYDINAKAFSHSQNLNILDLSGANLTSLKMGVFNTLRKVESLKLSGNPWKCDCYMYWLLVWLGEHANAHLLSPSETFCKTPAKLKDYVLLDALDHSMVCTNASISYHTNKTKFKVGFPAFLECRIEGHPLPSITWITPQKQAFQWDGYKNETNQTQGRLISTSSPNMLKSLENNEEQKSRFYLLQNGNLAIRNVERGDGGLYACIASNPLSYDSVSIRLTLDYEYFVHIKIVSVLVGLATSFGFLLLTLISILIKMILKHFGVRCPCSNGNASPRTQQIKKILESMEHYKKQQLDKLRDNYNVQVQKIKDNCMQQMERLRESYSSQAERLRDIKEYGTLQIDRIRENYYLQVQRVRDYSASQIVRLRENYICQRNRIRKFSAHHLYKLRENYKVQQQHLNKILENLNIESCRNVCHRTDSVVFEPDITLENVLVPKICLQTLPKETSDFNDNSSQLSAYFTPDEAGSEISGHESDEGESFDNTLKLSISEADITMSIENTAPCTSNIPNHCENSSLKQDVHDSNEIFSNETIV